MQENHKCQRQRSLSGSDGENKDDWIQLKNPKTRKIIFFKVPTNREKNEYKSEMMSKLRSDNPVIPIIIKKLRVTNKAEL